MRVKSTEDLQKFIVSILLVGVSLVIALYVSGALHTTLQGTNSTSLTVTNETGAFANSTGYTLGAVNSSNSGYTLTAAWDGSGGAYNVSVPLSNLALSSSGVLTNATATTYSNLSVSYNYTYTYNYETSSSTAANNLTSALSNGTAWISILVVVGFAIVVLSLLTEGLGGAAREAERGVPYYG